MKQNSIWSNVIGMDMFYSEVIVFITNSKEYFEKDIDKVLSEDLGMKDKYVKDFTPKILKALQEEKVLPPGITLSIESFTGGKDIFVIFEGTPRTVCKETIIHEMCHATQYIMEERGIDDMETEAYMLEYLCHEVFESIANFNKKDNKT